MILQHRKYSKFGRIFDILDSPGQLCYKSGLGTFNLESEPGVFVPHIIDEGNGTVRFSDLVARLRIGGGIEILRGVEVIGEFGFHPEFKIGRLWVREKIIRTKVRVKRILNTEYSDLATLEIDLLTPSQKLTVTAEFSSHNHIKFKMLIEARKGGNHRIVVDRPKKIESNSILDKRGKVLGHQDDKGRWFWNKDEVVDHILDETDPDTVKVRIKEGQLAIGDTHLISPDTFGPNQIVTGNDDCQEADDTTISLNGFDSDGNLVGSRGGISYDNAWRWGSVPPVSGDTIDNGTNIQAFLKFTTGGQPRANVVGVREANPLDWSTGTRPSQRAQTTASVTWDPPITGNETFKTSPELKSIVQEIIDNTSHSVADSMAFIWKDNASPSGARCQYQDYGQQAGNAAKLTVVYTPGGGPVSGYPAAYYDNYQLGQPVGIM